MAAVVAQLLRKETTQTITLSGLLAGVVTITGGTGLSAALLTV